MAYDLLKAMRLKETINHQDHHDLESFIWVLHYSILRHLVGLGGVTSRQSVRDFFIQVFGHMHLRTIMASRYNGLGDFVMEIKGDISPPLEKLLGALDMAIMSSRPRPGAEHSNLTYDVLFTFLDRAIVEMQSL